MFDLNPVDDRLTYLVDTGEEGEDTLFTTRAKLFQYHPEKKAWAERGIGPFKLNVKRKDNEEIKTPAWKEEETDVEKEEQEEGENETAKNDEDETRVQPPVRRSKGDSSCGQQRRTRSSLTPRSLKS